VEVLAGCHRRGDREVDQTVVTQRGGLLGRGTGTGEYLIEPEDLMEWIGWGD